MSLACPGLRWTPTDPALPIDACRGSTTRRSQREKRSKIFAVARQHLAHYGFSGVFVRNIASECDISAQTIYNLVGDKRAMLGAAATQYILSLGRQACTRNGFPNAVLALGEGYARAAESHCLFMREATLCYYPPERSLHDPIYRASVDGAVFAAASLRSRGILGPDVNLRDFAIPLTLGWGAFMIDCVAGDLDFAVLKHRILTSARHMLAGVVAPSEVCAIDSWLAGELSGHSASAHG